MFTVVKRRCGIAPEITVYDDDIRLYIEDCKEDMLASGVPKQVLDRNEAGAVTAMTLYVKAHLGDDFRFEKCARRIQKGSFMSIMNICGIFRQIFQIHLEMMKHWQHRKAIRQMST